ncbi:MAG: protein-export chaperone SecB [Alphaproteobacteria bacterium]|nr:protein-export chaperone SecB [Alphaproteobacteria bacterium]
MNENSGNGGAETHNPAGGDLPALIINGQYVKDLSFESPNSPHILGDLQQGKQPDVNVNVDVQANKIEGGPSQNLFEVILEMRAELKVEGKTGFLVELKYAGAFTINVPEEHLGAMLLVECPRLLFPYARNIISDTTRDGGFVPLQLQPIDFAGMYRANLEQQAKTQAQAHN